MSSASSSADPFELRTDRLTLRRLDSSCAAFIVELLNDPAFLKFIGDRGVRTQEDAIRYVETGPASSYAKHGFGLYLMELRATGEKAGICGLLKRDELDDVDIGFSLLPAFRGSGLAHEAAAAVMDEGRDRFGLRRIAAIVSPGNERSERLLERLGFVFERMLRLKAGDEVRFFARPV